MKNQEIIGRILLAYTDWDKVSEAILLEQLIASSLQNAGSYNDVSSHGKTNVGERLDTRLVQNGGALSFLFDLNPKRSHKHEDYTVKSDLLSSLASHFKVSEAEVLKKTGLTHSQLKKVEGLNFDLKLAQNKRANAKKVGLSSPIVPDTHKNSYLLILRTNYVIGKFSLSVIKATESMFNIPKGTGPGRDSKSSFRKGVLAKHEYPVVLDRTYKVSTTDEERDLLISYHQEQIEQLEEASKQEMTATINYIDGMSKFDELERDIEKTKMSLFSLLEGELNGMNEYRLEKSLKDFEDRCKELVDLERSLSTAMNNASEALFSSY